jgi:hypothetical protein
MTATRMIPLPDGPHHVMGPLEVADRDGQPMHGPAGLTRCDSNVDVDPLPSSPLIDAVASAMRRARKATGDGCVLHVVRPVR